MVLATQRFVTASPLLRLTGGRLLPLSKEPTAEAEKPAAATVHKPRFSSESPRRSCVSMCIALTKDAFITSVYLLLPKRLPDKDDATRAFTIYVMQLLLKASCGLDSAPHKAQRITLIPLHCSIQA